MKIGISRAAPAEQAKEVLETAEKYGFEGVQLKEPQFRSYGLTKDKFEAAFPGLSHLAAGGLITYPGADITKWIDHVSPILDFAGEINAGHVCICAGVPRENVSDETFKQAAELMNTIGEKAIKAGIKVSLHNHADTPWEQEEDLAAITEHLNPDSAGLTIDTGHLAKAGISDMGSVIRKFKDYILNIHLKDFNNEGNFCPIGTGTIDLVSAVEAIKEIGYSEWLIVDEESKNYQTDEAFALSRKFLEEQGIP